MSTRALLATMVLVLPLVSSVYAQTSDLGSVLEKAQESLTGQAPKNETKIPKLPAADNVIPSVPQNSDIFVRTILTYKNDSLNPTWEIPENTTIYLSKGNKLCPQNNCLQEYQEGDLDMQGNKELYIYGILKIEDPLTSTPEFKNWKLYHVLGWSIYITKIQEDVKNNQTNYFFDGIFGFGEDQGTAQDVQYKIVGTFQEPSGKLEFSGKYSTAEAIIEERVRNE